MNGAVGCRLALRKRGAERGGGGQGGKEGWGGLLDVGGCWKTCIEGVSKQGGCLETVSKHLPQESTSNNSGIENNI